MCNLYRQRSGPQAILDLANAMRSNVGNLAPGEVYPDYAAPIVRLEGGERVLTSARWGMPSSKTALFDAATKRADKLRGKGGWTARQPVVGARRSLRLRVRRLQPRRPLRIDTGCVSAM